MKRWLFCLFFVLVFFIVIVEVKAGEYKNGYVNSDGYSWYNGYWYRGDLGYTRALYQRPGYYSCGYYYPATSYYRYSYSHTYQRQPAKVSYETPDWRTKLLDIAGQRDKAEASIRKGIFEQQYFMEAVKGLGLEGNFRWQNYGIAPPYSPQAYVNGNSYGSLNLSSAGVNGSSLYGYSYNSIANLYGDASLNVLYQQANRLTENAQKLSGQATTEFNSLIGAEGHNRARVAEILAKGQAAQEVLRAMDGSSAKIETKTYSFKVVPGPDGKPQMQKVNGDAPQQMQRVNGDQPQPQIQPQNGQDTSQLWQAAAKNRCASCHGGAKKEGGFDISLYPTMTPEQKLKVVSRILTTEEAKRMPRNPDGTPSSRLPIEEIQLWLMN